MKCRECQQQFEAALSRSADAPERAAVESHVRECPQCALAFAQARQVWELLGQTRTCQPSHGFADRVLRRLDAAPEAREPWWMRWSPSVRWAAVAAALVLLAGVTAVSLVQRERAAQRMQAQLDQKVDHFKDLLELVQNVDPDVVLNATSDDEGTL